LVLSRDACRAEIERRGDTRTENRRTVTVESLVIARRNNFRLYSRSPCQTAWIHFSVLLAPSTWRFSIYGQSVLFFCHLAGVS